MAGIPQCMRGFGRVRFFQWRSVAAGSRESKQLRNCLFTRRMTGLSILIRAVAVAGIQLFRSRLMT